jgi:hypothetical protein
MDCVPDDVSDVDGVNDGDAGMDRVIENDGEGE